VAPGDDFNQYANGGWLERTQLPADQPAYGVFNEIGDQVDAASGWLNCKTKRSHAGVPFFGVKTFSP
ncbi:MAG: hypothetical protein PHS88_05280, partial [Candidatus Omnitrophica bacterium]|nr:hypothetical protein [Candidatus Omnitrophota bacterium]